MSTGKNGEEIAAGTRGEQAKSGDPGSAQGLSRLGGEPARFRMLTVSLLAAGIGLLAGVVAFVLYKLIGFFTNLFFFHRIAWDFSSARFNTLGPWVIVTPVIGGIIVGIMAKYGSSKIK